MTKKLIPQNLIMVEHAANDFRSVSTMLRGKGDGREHGWLDFEKYHPEVADQELLMAQFSHQARYGRVKVKHPLRRKSKLVMGLVALAIIVF
jgi:hypothetical protein